MVAQDEVDGASNMSGEVFQGPKQTADTIGNIASDEDALGLLFPDMTNELPSRPEGEKSEVCVGIAQELLTHGTIPANEHSTDQWSEYYERGESS